MARSSDETAGIEAAHTIRMCKVLVLVGVLVLTMMAVFWMSGESDGNAAAAGARRPTSLAQRGWRKERDIKYAFSVLRSTYMSRCGPRMPPPPLQTAWSLGARDKWGRKNVEVRFAFLTVAVGVTLSKRGQFLSLEERALGNDYDDGDENSASICDVGHVRKEEVLREDVEFAVVEIGYAREEACDDGKKCCSAIIADDSTPPLRFVRHASGHILSTYVIHFYQDGFKESGLVKTFVTIAEPLNKFPNDDKKPSNRTSSSGKTFVGSWPGPCSISNRFTASPAIDFSSAKDISQTTQPSQRRAMTHADPYTYAKNASVQVARRRCNGMRIDDGVTQWDLRTQVPSCALRPLSEGHCSASWAFAAAGAFEKQLCYVTKGESSPRLSRQNILECGDQAFGCQGGTLEAANLHFKRDGAVEDFCLPFSASSSLNPSSFYSPLGLGLCKKLELCADPSGRSSPPTRYFSTLPVDESDSRSFVDSEGDHTECSFLPPFHTLRGSSVPDEDRLSIHQEATEYVSGERAMMQAVARYGAIAAQIQLFEDFSHYEGGVYFHQWGEFLGFHYVQLVGWGQTDDGVKYWIGENSWGTSWGESIDYVSCAGVDESRCGYFRIERGGNEVGIETRAGFTTFAGTTRGKIPLSPRSSQPSYTLTVTPQWTVEGRGVTLHWAAPDRRHNADFVCVRLSSKSEIGPSNHLPTSHRFAHDPRECTYWEYIPKGGADVVDELLRPGDDDLEGSSSSSFGMIAINTLTSGTYDIFYVSSMSKMDLGRVEAVLRNVVVATATAGQRSQSHSLSQNSALGETDALGCLADALGDGWCDEKNNNPNCNYDAGDCCPETCVSTGFPCRAQWGGVGKAKNMGTASDDFESHCLATAGKPKTAQGCVCEESWEYNGRFFKGCQDPDSVWGRNWCVVRSSVGSPQCGYYDANTMSYWDNCSNSPWHSGGDDGGVQDNEEASEDEEQHHRMEKLKSDRGCTCKDSFDPKKFEQHGCVWEPDRGYWCHVEESWCGFEEKTYRWDTCHPMKRDPLPSSRKTDNGCHCLTEWEYRGQKHEDCATVDGSSWCFTSELDCHGKGWDTCLPETNHGCTCKAMWWWNNQAYLGCAGSTGDEFNWCVVNEWGCGLKDAFDTDNPWWDHC